MKKNLLLILVLLVTSSLWAQQPLRLNQYDVTVNGNRIDLLSDLTQVASKLKTLSTSLDKIDAKEWLVIQLNSIPTQKEKDKLKQQGIELLDYIGSNAYYASVSPIKLTTTLSSGGLGNFRALGVISPEYKISPRLRLQELPDYAKDGSFVKVEIIFFANADINTIKNDLASIKIKDQKINADFQEILGSVSQADLDKIASFGWVQHINMVSPPLELYNSINSKNIQKANMLNSTIPGLGYGLTGKGVKVGLWDADVSRNNRDFSGRVHVMETEMHNSNHGNHTCGTIASAGLVDPRARGMAPEVEVFTRNFNTQSNGLTHYAEKLLSVRTEGIVISSNSYGPSILGCNTPGNLFGFIDYYNPDRQEDAIAWLYPYYLCIYAGGNSQTASFCLTKYYTVFKNNKNALFVAAVDKNENETMFSSYGPSFDGRMIPHITADGVDVYSNSSDNEYYNETGTSMACPGTSGTMALLYQRYMETHGGAKPLASLMMGLVCNTARDIGNPGPDYKYGFGLLNGYRAAQVMDKNWYFTNKVTQGGKITKDITVPAGAVGLRVMLTWMDYPGTQGAPRILVNNLDLSVTKDGVTTLPWVLDPSNPSKAAARGVDNLNNYEQVTVDNPVAGKYTITVDGTEVPMGENGQEFSVVYYIVMPTLELTYPIGNEKFAPEKEQIIRWESEGYNSPFVLEYSMDGGITYNILDANIDPSARKYTIDSTMQVDDMKIRPTAKLKFRISNSSAFSETKGFVQVMEVPQDVKIGKAQCIGSSSTTLTWNPVTNAKYQVLKLNGDAYEIIGETTSTSYAINDLERSNDNWFTVQAVDLATGAISERAVAVNANPAVPTSAMPYLEDFENEESNNFYFTSDYGDGRVRYVNDVNRYGFVLSGSSIDHGDWINATGASCFTQNPKYVVTATSCNIDASSLAEKQLWLKFDYRQKGTSHFRIKVNGTYLTNIDSTKIYSTEQKSYTTVYYDFSKYAGNPNLQIVFEAVCKNAATYNISKYSDDDAVDKGDFVAVDNIEIVETNEDLALVSLDVTNGITNAETVTITIKNMTGNPVTNVPVSFCRVDEDGNELTTPITETIPGPIARITEATYVFTAKADISAPGAYYIKASVNKAGDTNLENNDQTVLRVNNGTDIVLTNGATTTTCDGYIVDPGGRYLPYPQNITTTHTIAPADPSKAVKISFEKFDIEPLISTSADHLMVYSGGSVDANNLMADIYYRIGDPLPQSFTSFAADGKLTLRFVSDPLDVASGFIAKAECVEKPTRDLVLADITGPAKTSEIGLSNAENIKITIKSRGSENLTNVQVCYQINDNAQVCEIIPTINGFETKTYTFAQTADLSAAKVYKIKAWIDLSGDLNPDDNTKVKTVTNTLARNDLKVNSVSTFPRRSKNSPISVIGRNNGNTATPNFPFSYQINGGATISETRAGQINGGNNTASWSFPTLADLTVPRAYNIKACVSHPMGDSDPSNDCTEYNVTKEGNASLNVVGSFKSYDGGVTYATATGANITADRYNIQPNSTIELWVKPGKLPNYYGTILSKGLSIHYVEDYTQWGKNCIAVQIQVGLNYQAYVTPNNSILQDRWSHIALTIATDGSVKIYINGVEQPLNNATKVATMASNLSLGLRMGTSSLRPFVGELDEVRVWSEERSNANIAASMTTNFAANTPNMVAYYKFQEEKGNYLYDYAANDLTAPIANGGDLQQAGNGFFWNTPTLFSNVSFAGQVVPTSYDPDTKTFTAIVNDEADLTIMATNFVGEQRSTVKIGGVIQISGTSTNDFTNPVTYTVEGNGFNSGITQTYTVKVMKDLNSGATIEKFGFSKADNPSLSSDVNLTINGNYISGTLPFGTDVSTLKAKYELYQGAKLYYQGTELTSSTVIDYRMPIMVRVVSENGREFKNYTIDVNARNNAADLISFSIMNDQVGNTAINKESKTVKIVVKDDANVAMLVPQFQVSENATLFLGSVAQISGASAVNFTNPVKYTIVSEDGSTSTEWTVTVVKMAAATSDVVVSANPAQGGVVTGSASGIPYNTSHTITATANNGYHFIGWSKDGVTVSTATNYTLTITEDATYVAEFALITQLTELTGVTIGGQPFDITQTYPISCGSTTVEAVIGLPAGATLTSPDATVVNGNTLSINATKAGKTAIRFTVTSSVGTYSENYTLYVERGFTFSDYVVQKQNHVLMLDLKKLAADGLNVTGYKWFKNGTQVGTGSYYTPGESTNDKLDNTADYSVELTLADGTKLISCPGKAIQKSGIVIAYPNPVDRGQKLSIKNEDGGALVDGTVADIYDMSGRRVSQQPIDSNASSLAMPTTTGTYMIILRSKEGSSETIKVIVK